MSPGRLGALAPSVGAALLPKCPFCVLALASGLEAVGIAPETYDRALLPLLVFLLGAPALFLGFSRKGTARTRTLALMGFGAGLYLVARFQEWPLAVQAGFGFPYAGGALWKAAPCCGAAPEPKLAF